MAEREPLLTPALVALTLGDLAYFTAIGLLIPVTPQFASDALGAGEVGVGFAVGAFSATALVLRPFAGRTADRRGRRALLTGGALGVAVVIALHPLADHLGTLVALRLALGAAEAFFFVASFAVLADLAPASRRGEALSFNSLSLYLGIAFGPLLGEALLELGGFDAAFLGGAALALTAAALTTRVPETAPPPTGDPEPTPLVNRSALGPGLALGSGVAAMAGYFAFVALHAEDLGMGGAGGVLLAFGIVVVVCRIAFARLADRLPALGLGTTALVLCALGMAVSSSLATQAGLYLGATVLAVGIAFLTPAMFRAIFDRVPDTQRGSASGTATVCIDLGFGGGPILAGLVAGMTGIAAAFGALAALPALGAAAIGIAAARSDRGRDARRRRSRPEARPR